MTIEKISISIMAKDRNYTIHFTPEESPKTIDEAIEFLESIKNEFPKEEKIPF